ncbi:manganese efflux pump MntP family protein [Tepidibacillus marianensis]|uniref:manganese efflux pump MntP n=1 Tax=Tepidibacillus marianensis TaxID=3131995 RepID=UPI0030CF1A0A
MGLTDVYFGEFITFLMIAVALGMDAFSLGIGIGMQGLSIGEITKVSITIGIFHIIMPLVGVVIGHYLSSVIGDIATFIGGSLLVLLGVNMVLSSFWGKDKPTLNQVTGIGLLLLAFSVSIDALSIGISLGLFSENLWYVVLLFGLMGGVMTALGLTIGTKIGHWLGEYGEMLGGIILLVFGIKILV